MHKSLLSLALMAALGGCSLIPDYERPTHRSRPPGRKARPIRKTRRRCPSARLAGASSSVIRRCSS